ARTLRNFYKALVDGGWLIVSPAEATPTLFHEYEMVTEPDVLLYRKGAARAIARKLPEASAPWAMSLALPPQQIEARRPSPPSIARPSSSASKGHQDQSMQPEPARQGNQHAVAGWEAAHKLYAVGSYAAAREELLALTKGGIREARVFALLARIE